MLERFKIKGLMALFCLSFSFQLAIAGTTPGFSSCSQPNQKKLKIPDENEEKKVDLLATARELAQSGQIDRLERFLEDPGFRGIFDIQFVRAVEDAQRRTPQALNIAAHLGEVEIVRALLTQPQRFIVDPHGEPSALHRAVFGNCVDVIVLLMGVDPALREHLIQQGHWGLGNPLQEAFRHGNTDAAYALLGNGFPIGPNAQVYAESAALWGDVRCVSFLLGRFPVSDNLLKKVFRIAVREGRYQLAIYMMRGYPRTILDPNNDVVALVGQNLQMAHLIDLWGAWVPHLHHLFPQEHRRQARELLLVNERLRATNQNFPRGVLMLIIHWLAVAHTQSPR